MVARFSGWPVRLRRPSNFFIMLRALYQNHVFANLTFALVLILGALCYLLLPRQQDPDMNFNWISIITVLPGASAEDVEKRLTDPLEEAIQKVADIHFVLSGSREGLSDILVRFNEVDERTFDKRVSDLRREVDNKRRELPEAAEDPFIMEITSSNGFPTAMVVVQGEEEDENLRFQAQLVKKSLERIKGVDRVTALGLHDPELQVRFLPSVLGHFGLTPMDLVDTLAARFRDISGGSLRRGAENVLLRLQGTTADPAELARWPVLGGQGEHPLGEVAQVSRGRKKAAQMVRYQGKPAVLLSLTKQPGSHVLDLIQRIQGGVDAFQALQEKSGVRVVLADDQTFMVKNALGVMEKNALLGLLLVILTNGLFFGRRIALLIGLGIPFTLAGTFALIYTLDGSLNIMVLLGVVIALGMLVDDAVVVVEAIYARLLQGMSAMDAGLAAMREVAVPVMASVLTTMAAFLPLILLPGILGKFMRVIPLVVSAALLISLLEAFWMLPAHVVAMGRATVRSDGERHWRVRFLHRLRLLYLRALLKIFRRPKRSILFAIFPMVMALVIVATGLMRVDFFAMDPMPLFYINIKMPAGTALQHTMDTVLKVEQIVQRELQPGESRAVVSYAGQMFTETQPFFGDRYGQILVSLTPDNATHRPVAEIIAILRSLMVDVQGPESLIFLPMSGGPPVTKPISVKVLGEDFQQLRAAADAIKAVLAKMPEVRDITDDFSKGGAEWVLRPDGDAIRRAGLHPAAILRFIRLLADGEIAAHFQHQGEKVEVRVLAQEAEGTVILDPLKTPIPLPGGGLILLESLVSAQTNRGAESIRHFNFRRAITVEAELDKTRLDVVTANQRIQEAWESIAPRFPGLRLDFTGILDDIYEALDAIGVLFLLGLGLMYMILGTQFRSYFQPLMIFITVPMAFTGVVFGTLVSGQSLSLYTLYGVVALSGIAVNASIVLISAIRDRRGTGMTLLHATLYAARRRLVPILITSVTTIAGLFSLAVGLGGHSLLWGPVATAIVWGMLFSTLLTLFLVPLLFFVFVRRRGVD